MNEKIMEKARAAKSADEILALAKENDIELTPEEARETFELLSKTGEISDEELDNVSGGGCKTNVDGKKYVIVTSGLGCFTGAYECNCERYADSRGRIYNVTLLYEKDHSSLRKTWARWGAEGDCGLCRWLKFKGGLGYCSKSAE